MRVRSDDQAPQTVEAAAAAKSSKGELPSVGANLRRLRRRKGYSLERLASISGVSRAMLGQIELSQSTPTINLLWRIATGLGIPFGALLSALLGEEEDTPTTVLRAQGAARLTSADGSFVSRPLFPFGQGPRRTEFYELRLAAHGIERANAHPRGTLENLVVASGSALILVGSEQHALETGDALIFRADVPHSYQNAGATELVIYLVMTYDLAPDEGQ